MVDSTEKEETPASADASSAGVVASQQPLTRSDPPYTQPKERNFCPCCPLATGVLAAAIGGIIYYSLVILVGILLLVLHEIAGIKIAGKVAGPIFIVAGILGVASSIVLLLGVKKKSQILVKVAFIGYIITLLLHIAGQVAATFLSGGDGSSTKSGGTTTTPKTPRSTTKKPKESGNDGWLSTIGGAVVGVIILVVSGYVLQVIWEYLKQLKRSGGQVVGEGTGDKFPVGPAAGVESSASNAGPPQPVGQELPKPVGQ